MSHYQHLTINERESILQYLSEGNGVRSISRLVGRSPSTISRELKRNSTSRGYWPSEALLQYQKRRKKCRRQRILSQPSSCRYVQQKIMEEQ